MPLPKDCRFHQYNHGIAQVCNKIRSTRFRSEYESVVLRLGGLAFGFVRWIGSRLVYEFPVPLLPVQGPAGRSFPPPLLNLSLPEQVLYGSLHGLSDRGRKA